MPVKQIKIIDIPDLETSAEKIAAHLTKFLIGIRSYKLRSDHKLGNDLSVKGSDNCDNDFDDEPVITYIDNKRISDRANRLSKARRASAGLMHLKREEIERLEPVLRGMQIILSNSTDWADKVAAELHQEMPWMGRATEYAWHSLRRSAQRGDPVLIRPVILNGPPGIGKSVWARSLAAALAIPYADVDASKGGAGMSLVGVERGWATAQAGRPLDVMLSKKLANPLIIVDEVCKARSITSTKGTSHAFADALLSLLEPATAKAWDCPYFRVRFDMSHIGPKVVVMNANAKGTVIDMQDRKGLMVRSFQADDGSVGQQTAA